MKIFKPVYISILTIVIFVGTLLIGMQTDWWQTEGRKTPLDTTGGGGKGSESGIESEEDAFVIKGSSTLQDALDLGLSNEQLSQVLEGSIEDESPYSTIKDIAVGRGLKFGPVKDSLNAMLTS